MATTSIIIGDINDIKDVNSDLKSSFFNNFDKS